MSTVPISPRVELSVNLPSYRADDPGSWDFVLDRARLLDAAGVDRLVVSDHVVFGERLEEYGRPEIGGQAGGVQPTGPDGHWLEPLTTLSVAARPAGSGWRAGATDVRCRFPLPDDHAEAADLLPELVVEFRPAAGRTQPSREDTM